MGLPNGLHHLAICTKDIKGQVEFFTQVCGMELVALYWMHGVDNTFHGFLKLSDSSSIALVQSPEIGEIQGIKGVSHAGNPGAPVAAGVVQHIALNVDSEADLLAMRDRVRSHGYWVMGPIDHGFCKSIYLSAPEGITLEFSTSEGKGIDADAWIDPEVQRLSGITASDLRRYRNPPAFESQGGKVPQPAPNSGKPMMDGMERLYKMTDEEITARLSQPTPPVDVSKKA
jgi:catechol 2,3-dioxygenase-like lactoylglutathione lyase family enzyme